MTLKNIVFDGMDVSKEQVQRKLLDIEKDYNCKVLYCCESGSRCWDMASSNSDYDVRFIYVRPEEHYLRVDLEFQRDVIDTQDIPIVNDLDISGWDLRKALHLLYKSNPPLIEWLNSPIVYLERNEFAKQTKALSDVFFSPVKSIFHYLHMAEKNYRQYLQREEVELKKYFYVLRPLLACSYIERTGKMAPVKLPALIESEMADNQIKESVLRLLEDKRNGMELGTCKPIQVIDDYLNHKINHFKTNTKKYDVPEASFGRINQFFLTNLRNCNGE